MAVQISDRAEDRFNRSAPPRKDKNATIGDAINWEWMLFCAEKNAKDIVIVSRDLDHGVEVNGELIVNDWLRDEFHHIPMLDENNVRTGFFEPEQFAAVYARLPDDLQGDSVCLPHRPAHPQRDPPARMAPGRLTGGTVRLDRGTTKNDDGR